MTKLDKALERYACNAEYERAHGNLQGCREFKHLCEWLEELREYRKMYHKEHADNCVRAESEGVKKNDKRRARKRFALFKGND